MVASNLDVILVVVSLAIVVLAIIFLSVYWLNRVVDSHQVTADGEGPHAVGPHIGECQDRQPQLDGPRGGTAVGMQGT